MAERDEERAGEEYRVQAKRTGVGATWRPLSQII